MVRLMTAADKERVVDILGETAMFTPQEVAVAEELIDETFAGADSEGYVHVVAEDETREVVGYLNYGSTPLTEGTFDVYWIAVSPSKQGRGVGRELMLWMEDSVRSAGGRLILIETSSQPGYEPTCRFYEALGYMEVSRIAHFYKKGDDRITFAKYLE